MIGHAIIYHTNGTTTTTDFSKSPSLKFLQEAVGGYIEAVPYFHLFTPPGAAAPVRCIAFCDEEGKYKNAPRLGINHEATMLWQEAFPGCDDILVGPVIVLWGDDAFMRNL
jgi:hypothetical protein